jgi:MFS family permease
MFRVLQHTTYRRLFAAQALSLIGTGLTTVALSLLAYDIAGANAGVVLGTAFALKMVAYVGITPFAGVFAAKLPRRAFLVALDLCRAALVFFLPFVSEVWQVYVLVFAFQSFSAAFTPTFQATIPDVLSDERDYTEALSLSRLAYDLESLVSPMLAGLLLIFISFNWLFVGTTVGFLASAALVLSVTLRPAESVDRGGSFFARLTRGLRTYLATPRLRGLLALSFAVAASGAMVIVNTVVYVRENLGGSNHDVAIFLACFGLGSMAVALVLPRLLDRLPDRTVMLSGGAMLPVLLAVAAANFGYAGSLVIWVLFGVGSSLIQTPAGLLLARSSQSDSRPALFSAQFALSHACWLVTYPVAGWSGARFGLDATFFVMAAGALCAVAIAAFVWPNDAADVAIEAGR